MGREVSPRPNEGPRWHADVYVKRCGDRGGNGPELALHQPSPALTSPQRAR